MKLSTFSNLLLAGVASSLFLSSGHAESERQRRPDPGSRTAHVSSRSHNDRNSNNNDRNRNFRDRDNRWSGNRDRDNRRNYSKHGHRYYGHHYNGHHYSGRRSYGYPYRSGIYSYGYSPYYYGYPGTSISVGVGSGYYATDYAGTYRRDDRPVYRGELAEENDSSLELSVQRKLARLGFYKGSIDGDIGPSTRRAISRFQEENDLDVTGRIDRELVEELDLD